MSRTTHDQFRLAKDSNIVLAVDNRDITIASLNHLTSFLMKHLSFSSSSIATSLFSTACTIDDVTRNNIFVQVSIDGQHQGVFGFPGCPVDSFDFCEVLRDLLDIAYVESVQSTLVQAQYWHDPFQKDLHRLKYFIIIQ